MKIWYPGKKKLTSTELEDLKKFIRSDDLEIIHYDFTKNPRFRTWAQMKKSMPLDAKYVFIKSNTTVAKIYSRSCAIPIIVGKPFKHSGGKMGRGYWRVYYKGEETHI